MNEAAVSVHMQVFVWTYVSFLLDIRLGMELPGHVESLTF